MIFVTGATGFIGRHLLPRLVARGEGVRCLIDDESDAAKLASHDVEVKVGSVEDAEALRQAVRGARSVVHLVATPWKTSGGVYERVNRLGTRHVARAAAEAGAAHLLHLSSLGASPDQRYAYTFSKWQSEQEVRASGAPFTILQPSIVSGPESQFFGGLRRLIEEYPVVPLPGDGRARFQPILVDDVVTAMLRVLDAPSDYLDEAIPLGGPSHVTYERLVDLTMEAVGVWRPKVPMPVDLLVPLVELEGFLAPNPIATTPQVHLLSRDNLTDLDVVERRFGFRPASLRSQIEASLPNSKGHQA